MIQDSGKGMPQEIVTKILNNLAVATDKEHGHGIGLTQIRETLQANHGKLAIDSELDKGTKMILTFPKVKAPEWIAQEINLNPGDTIVILDDDLSIHGAWDSRLKEHLTKIQVKHFIIGQEAIEFINSFPKKEKILLLTDYELLKQGLTGINVIERTATKRAILITSHYAVTEVQSLAIKNEIRILPKQLAAEVPIKIGVADNNKTDTKIAVLLKTDIVIIDDNETLANSMALLFKNYNKTIEVYYSTKQFLKQLSRYAKETKIFMDNNFGGNSISGIELAQQLHEKGFTQLYIFSGEEFKAGEIPDFLTAIMKTDIDALCKVI